MSATDDMLGGGRYAPTRGRPVQREWALQRGVTRFVKRAVLMPHRFACFDRGAAASDAAHIWEAERGIRGGEPDTELLVPGMPAVRIELKFPPNKLDPNSQQAHEIKLINRCGHHAGWADSVMSYALELERVGAPLLPNWRTVAMHEDQLVAGDVRGREVKAAAAGPVVLVKSAKPKRRARGRTSKAGITHGITSAMQAGLGRR